MLIRVVLENIFSFGKQREFNMLPYKRLGTLPHHQYDLGGISLLKMASVYGANGAGKSNLIKTLELLQSFVREGKYPYGLKDSAFKFNSGPGVPQTIALEFIEQDIAYVYAVQLKGNVVFREELYRSGLSDAEDVLIYERFTKEDKTVINFAEGFNSSDQGKVLKDILVSDFIHPDILILKLLSNRESDYFDDCRKAFQWITKTLVIILPAYKPNALAEILDNNSGFKSYAEDMMRAFNVGISSLQIEKKSVQEFFGEDNERDVFSILEMLEDSPGSLVRSRTQGNDDYVVVKENDKYWVKQLRINHSTLNKEAAFDLAEESDGTNRLLDFVPAFRALSEGRKVFLIDEIERSIHPLLIKKLVEKFSLDTSSQGQLIFTTHESNLLDQSIFRQDEIWFAEKDTLGSTDLYSLSKFKEHKTLDIQKGYLSGRYGAIPFLNDLETLNWHQYDTEEATL
ncbi:ATP-binding protein [Neolewinella lacunae]|uniref:ATP-binding protein n=1 Tax=Neolewinella lacunae TaxID=1517758 RepID=A0A923T9M8_9BACT|nr:ATP-binding protein [Neolewinella lacunae]MBC6995694.1 ATP-binding protein [Neolewinella lacunae]MDN3636613.1 ATP-binding protein [Neolewinella lacunae]